MKKYIARILLGPFLIIGAVAYLFTSAAVWLLEAAE